jgi:hypothetical protein
VALMYSLTANDEETGHKIDRVVLLDAERVICAEAHHTLDHKSELVWGEYKPCGVWPDMTGFRSKAAKRPPRRDIYQGNDCLSVRQAGWWKRQAKRYGLDPAAVDEITTRQFDALPVLRALGERLGEDE